METRRRKLAASTEGLSTSRHWRHVKSGLFSSRIVRGLKAPLAYVAIVSTAVCTYETALLNKLLPDLGFVWPSLTVNFTGPFSLSTFALSLLLVFRTNSSYQRWNEARRFWGLLINRSRDIARQALQWTPPEEAAVAAAICRWTAAFPLVLMCSLRNDVQLEASLRGVLQADEVQLVLRQPHPGSAILQALGQFTRASGMKELHKMRIDENITVLQDVMGGCERIFRTPIPLSFTRHTSRFLVCWLTCLPFCMAETMGWSTVPVAIGLAFFLFGIEEIGVQIEEPFGILALEIFCTNIIRNIRQAEQLAATLQAASAAPGAGSALQAAPGNPLDSESPRPGSITDLSYKSNIVVGGFTLLPPPAGISEVQLVQPDAGLLLTKSSLLVAAEQQKEGGQQQQHVPCKQQELCREQTEELAVSGMSIHYATQDEGDFL
eukprot:gene10169-10327_t